MSLSGQRRVLLVSVLAAACAGSPPRAAPRNIDVAAPRSEDAPILVPASAPADLLLLGRVQDPRSWLRLQQTPPLLLEPLRALLPEPGVLELIDFSAPAEFALGWAPGLEAASESAEEVCEDDCPPPADGASEFSAALSLGLSGWDPASLEQLGFARSGALGYARGNCVAEPALGSAPARLICSPSRDQLRALEAYMARGLPLEELGSAPLAIQLRPRPVREAWKRYRPSLELALQSFSAPEVQYTPFTTFAPNPELRAAVLEAGKGLLQEVDTMAQSLDSVTLEARPTPEDGLEIALTLGTRDPQSWFVGALARANAGAGPPAQFERLPSMFVSAGFSWGVDARDSATMVEAIRNVWPAVRAALDAYFPRHQVLDALSSYLVAALSSQCMLVSQDVWADAPYRPDGNRAPRSQAEQIRATLGHQLIGSPAEAKCGEFLRSGLERLIASKDVKQSLAEIDRGFLLRKIRVPPGLAPNTSVFQLQLPPAVLEDRELLNHIESFTELFLFNFNDISFGVPDGPLSEEQPLAKSTQPLLLTLVVQPTPSGDWIGLSAAPEQLYGLMRQLTSADKAAGKPRPELARLETPRLLTAEYFTLERMVVLDAVPALRDFLRQMTGDGARAPIVSTTRFQREQRGVKGRIDFYLSPPAVSGLRQLATLDPAAFAWLERAFRPSLAFPLE